ncbi:PDR/VanB family oxidoreductase [Streptomyces antimycoticus]|uniref:PDR/VanB family oxidoreductase n=1 Tax=Streptomyces antimycoticus TaxID=68175 RepID=UPI00340E93BA
MYLLVTHKQSIAENVVALTLSDPDGCPLPAWTPGAHVDIALEPGLSRPYSLTGGVDSGVWRVAVLRVPTGRGSRYLHDTVAPGSVLRIDGPRNDFPLIPARRYVFIAGGIGITPILPMVSEVERSGAEWQLYYGGRRRASMAFLDELARYGDRVHVYPEDEQGLLPLSTALRGAASGTRVYCCGPELLLDAVRQHVDERPGSTVHFERFRPTGDALGECFEVRLARSGHTLTVPPGKSILEVVEEAGVEVLSSCRTGTCGTCETAVLGGIPDHRDDVLSADERESGDVMMICTSRSLTPQLALDL